MAHLTPEIIRAYFSNKLGPPLFLFVICQDPSRCLKITGKVSFNIASEASYLYILRGQKLIKNGKNGPFWRVFESLELAVKQRY